MKKALLVFAFLVAGVGSAHSIGLGLEGYFGGGWNDGPSNGAIGGGAVTVGTGSITNPNWLFAVSGGIWDSSLRIGFTFDKVLWNPSLAYWCQFYLGVGGAANVGFGSNMFNIGAGVRLPLGFRFLIARVAEIFIEIAPTIGFSYWHTNYNSNSRNHFYIPTFNLPAAIGFRIWF